MKKYKLKILYPSVKQYAHQSYIIWVLAKTYTTNNGVFEFWVDNEGSGAHMKSIACYPTQYTIIEEIITIEDEVK